jgi:hypothetical protein
MIIICANESAVSLVFLMRQTYLRVPEAGPETQKLGTIGY